MTAGFVLLTKQAGTSGRVSFVNSRCLQGSFHRYKTPSIHCPTLLMYQLVCSICQFCYSGTSSKLFDLSQNCVLESTELILPIPNIWWNSRIRIQNSTWRHAREQCSTVKCKKNILQIQVKDMFIH